MSKDDDGDVPTNKKGKKGKSKAKKAKVKARNKAEKVKAAASKAKAVTAEKATNAFDGVIEAIDNLGSDKNR